MMSIDQVETLRCDLSQEYRSRQVSRLNSGLIEPVAGAVIRDLRQLDDLGGESFRVGGNESEEPRDIELKDAVRVELVAGLRRTGFKPRIASKLD
ncbi:MAG: hypothetical protein ACREV7_11220 [Steroidobacteraceae bacterium]